MKSQSDLIRMTQKYVGSHGGSIDEFAADVIIQTCSSLYKDIDYDAKLLADEMHISDSEARGKIVKEFLEFIKRESSLES